MMGKKGRVACVVALVGACVSAAPVGAASCWNGTEIAAELVRELQTMMMVAALRCRASGEDILADYDAFVVANRDRLVTANTVLRSHFWSAAALDGQADYDHFTTALANAYGGGGAMGGERCADAADLARQGAGAASQEDLLALAAQRLPERDLPGGACGVTMAMTDPAP